MFENSKKEINENIVPGKNAGTSATGLKETLLTVLDDARDAIADANFGIIGAITTSQELSVLNSLPDGVYEAQTSGLYKNGLTAKEGYYTRFRKTANVWQLESETKIPMQDLTPLENRTTALEAGLIMAEDDINTLEGIIQLVKDDVTALENKNGGDVEFGNTKNVEGGKVFNYSINNNITKYDITRFNDGYPKEAIVIHEEVIYKSLQDQNSEEPSNIATLWKKLPLSDIFKGSREGLVPPSNKTGVKFLCDTGEWVEVKGGGGDINDLPNYDINLF
ncbi:hypothetical protein [Empedobacter sp.]|uniref:hypothetical protein n=1 Tax=Empedobacter sp. TaxID=1927715 RepID=UPI002899BB9E|nr:hypothetical protein [Empedobacter sp.]